MDTTFPFHKRVLKHLLIFVILFALHFSPHPSWALKIQVPPLYGKYGQVKFSTGPIIIKDTTLKTKSLILELPKQRFYLPVITGYWRQDGSFNAKGTVQIMPIPLFSQVTMPWSLSFTQDAKNQGEIKFNLVPFNYPIFLSFKWPASDGAAWEALIRPEKKPLTWSKGLDTAVEGLVVNSICKIKGETWIFDTLTGTLSLNISQGQALYLPWFFDFSKHPLQLKSDFFYNEYDIIINNLKFLWLFNLFIKNLSIHPDSLTDPTSLKDWLASSSWEQFTLTGDLKDIYAKFIQEPYSDAEPILNKLKVEGNVLASLMKDKISVEGTAQIHWQKKHIVQDLQFFAPQPIVKNKCFKGELSWKKTVIPLKSSLTMKPSHSIPLNLCYEHAEVGPVDIVFEPEGGFSVKKLHINLKQGEAHGKDIKLAPIQLKKLFPDLPIQAELSAAFKEASIKNKKIVLTGNVYIKIGSGQIVISDIWVEPSGPFPTWGGNITFSGLELADLTKQTSFGYMTGKIRGYVKNLIMSGMEPVAFDMLIETDPNYKGERKISADAVESLSIIGGGAGIPLIGRFFKTYSYSKLGIRCRLHNDIFTLRGLIKEGDIEYLIKRGFPFGVNVINRNPNGKISFKDMLDRLKRIKSKEEPTKE